MENNVTHAKPVSYSRSVLTELMIPANANFGGKIHGGTILSLMDKAAYACAARHSGNYCVTASIDLVEFLMPIEVGELVCIKASVNHVGKSSMVIGIRVESENVKTGVKHHTNTSYFTMIAKDEEGKITEVPALLLENKEDIRRFLEAIKRKKLKSDYKEELDNTKTTLSLHKDLNYLEHERCVLSEDALNA
jgi:uncharacterized protein (TIGR00369 family)